MEICYPMKKFRRKKKKDRLGERFLDNGSKMLRELVAACDGKTNPIRRFSSDQILKATNNFDEDCIVRKGPESSYYEGYIKDRFYIIKGILGSEEQFYNDLVVSARVSDHKNFLGLVGCCLEFPVPVLVFEYAENGALDGRGRINGSEGLLPWNVRLKIAKEVANAVTYLHTAFPRIIIHRDMKPTRFFLDKNWSPKLYDFSLSISPPEGKSQIEDLVCVTFGFLDPEYLHSSIVTEYTDVYSFGVLLLILLTGESAIPQSWDWDGPSYRSLLDIVKESKEKGEFIGVRDEGEDIAAGQKRQMEAFLELALRCCEERAEDRPKMIEVVKGLKHIERSLDESVDEVQAGNASSSISTESDKAKWKLHLDKLWVVRLAIPTVIAVVVAIAIAVVKAHELHTYL